VIFAIVIFCLASLSLTILCFYVIMNDPVYVNYLLRFSIMYGHSFLVNKKNKMCRKHIIIEIH